MVWIHSKGCSTFVFSGLHFFTSVLQLKPILDVLAGCFRPPYDRSAYFRMMDPCLKDAEWMNAEYHCNPLRETIFLVLRL